MTDTSGTNGKTAVIAGRELTEHNGVAKTSPPGNRGGARRLIAFVAGIAVLIVIGIFGARWLAYNRSHASTDDAAVDGDVYAVSPKISGRVSRVLTDTNRFVHEGDLLIELDSSDLQAQLAEARANLAMQIANARAAGASVSIVQTTSGSNIGQARAGVDVAKTQLEAASEQAKAGLAGINSAEAGVTAARAGVVDAENNVRSAEAGVNSSQEAVAADTQAIKVAQQQVTGAQAAVHAAQQQVQVAAAEVASASASAQRAESDLRRGAELLKEGAVSKSQADMAQEAASTAEANLEAARQRQAAAVSAVDQARAAVAAASGGVQQAIAHRNQDLAAVSQSQIAVQNAHEAVRSAETKVTQAVAAVQSAQRGQSALQADIDQQQAKVAQSQASLRGTQAAPQQVNVSRSQEAQALAMVQQAKAKINELLLQIADTRITAPHDGVITEKNVTVGLTVLQGQPLLAIADLAATDVTANFKETQLKGMRIGSPAEITVDAIPGRTFKGHVQSFSPGTGAVFSLLPPENATGNFTKVVQRVPVKISIDPGMDSDRSLRLGMSANVTVTTGS